MKRLNLPTIKHSCGEVRKYQYLALPEALISEPCFAEIDYGAKILYSILLNRANLSAQHRENFTDENDDLYVIFTVEQIMRKMDCSRPTAIKFLKQLDEIGLIDKRKPGQGKATRIYPKRFDAIYEDATIIKRPIGEKQIIDVIDAVDFYK